MYTSRRITTFTSVNNVALQTHNSSTRSRTATYFFLSCKVLHLHVFGTICFAGGFLAATRQVKTRRNIHLNQDKLLMHSGGSCGVILRKTDNKCDEKVNVGPHIFLFVPNTGSFTRCCFGFRAGEK